jgi:hypothetical protein
MDDWAMQWQLKNSGEKGEEASSSECDGVRGGWILLWPAAAAALGSDGMSTGFWLTPRRGQFPV